MIIHWNHGFQRMEVLLFLLLEFLRVGVQRLWFLYSIPAGLVSTLGRYTVHLCD